MGVSWKFRFVRHSTSLKWPTGPSGPCVETPNPPEERLVEYTADTAEQARELCASWWGLPIDRVEHVLDEAGRPVYREFQDPPSSRRSLRASARDGEDRFGR